MARLNVLLIAILVFLLVIAVDPQVWIQTLNVWESMKPALADLQAGLVVIINEITNRPSDVPSEDNRPPTKDGPVYNANLVRPHNFFSRLSFELL